ncbi:MAG TPA: helix-turn-helix transcriptional regulator [Allosphingosinicella sp.]|jgi:DNA-binding CsgD family transcriptional regulator
MDAKRLARLTDQQRTCLRLVSAGLTSKEIAPSLGIEPGSVDQHIKAAMRILDVGDRRTAARLLADHEGRTPQQLVYQPPEIAAGRWHDETGASTENGERQQQQREASAASLQEEQAPFAISHMGMTALPLPVWGAKPHHLSWVKRLGWIVVVAIGIALAFGALVSAIEALVRLRTG